MNQDYEVIKIIYDQGYRGKLQQVKLKEDNSGTHYLSLHLSNINISDQDFSKLRKLKFLNIIQPQNYYEEKYEKILIFPDLQIYKIKQEQINQSYYRILLQLALTYAELEKRQCIWPLNLLDQLYYAADILYISLIEFDFSNPIIQQTPFQIFKKFALQYFSILIPDIQNYLQYNQFKPIIDFLLEKNGNLHRMNYLNPPYENQTPIKLQSINEIGNSVVKGFNTPESLKLTNNKLCDQIVYKSTKFQSDEFKEQILQNIQREIELMELCFNSEYLVTCFAYIRIFEFSFILQKKFVGTLAEFLAKWQKEEKDRSEKQTIKDVLLMANRFALALKSLKKINILHRDLKPENLFIDHNEIHQSYIYIADFDRSKSIDGQMGDAMTTQNAQCTPKYDPPETSQSFEYDIFQFGLIILTIANKGRYIGNEKQGPRYFTQQEHDHYYSKEAITKALSHTNYHQSFIEIIAQCLKRKPEERPNIQQIYSIINPLYLATKIQKVRETLPSNQNKEQSEQQTKDNVRFQSQPSPNSIGQTSIKLIPINDNLQNVQIQQPNDNQFIQVNYQGQYQQQQQQQQQQQYQQYQFQPQQQQYYQQQPQQQQQYFQYQPQQQPQQQFQYQPQQQQQQFQYQPQQQQPQQQQQQQQQYNTSSGKQIKFVKQQSINSPNNPNKDGNQDLIYGQNNQLQNVNQNQNNNFAQQTLFNNINNNNVYQNNINYTNLQNNYRTQSPILQVTPNQSPITQQQQFNNNQEVSPLNNQSPNNKKIRLVAINPNQQNFTPQ